MSKFYGISHCSCSSFFLQPSSASQAELPAPPHPPIHSRLSMQLDTGPRTTVKGRRKHTEDAVVLHPGEHVPPIAVAHPGLRGRQRDGGLVLPQQRLPVLGRTAEAGARGGHGGSQWELGWRGSRWGTAALVSRRLTTRPRHCGWRPGKRVQNSRGGGGWNHQGGLKTNPTDAKRYTPCQNKFGALKAISCRLCACAHVSGFEAFRNPGQALFYRPGGGAIGCAPSRHNPGVRGDPEIFH